MNGTAEQRFWAKVDTSSGEGACWLWRASVNRGYGQFKAGGVNTAHRFSWVLHGGDLIPGLQLDHLCRNKLCVNPRHLELVTPRINTLRAPCGAAQENARKTHCPQGHPYDTENTRRSTRGSRLCHVCRLAAYRRLNQKRKAAAHDYYVSRRDAGLLPRQRVKAIAS